MLLALAVTLRNAEEMIWLPGLSNPYLPQLGVDPRAFRFAAAAIALLFWLVAFALLSGMPVTGMLAGFSMAMIFNAVAQLLTPTVAM